MCFLVVNKKCNVSAVLNLSSTPSNALHINAMFEQTQAYPKLIKKNNSPRAWSEVTLHRDILVITPIGMLYWCELVRMIWALTLLSVAAEKKYSSPASNLLVLFFDKALLHRVKCVVDSSMLIYISIVTMLFENLHQSLWHFWKKNMC